MKTSKTIYVVLLVVLSLLLGGCESETVYLESENTNGYWDDKYLDVEDMDKGIYHLYGTVTADAGSLTRQTSPATGYIYGGTNTYGSFTGAQFSGKGFVRLLIDKNDGPVGIPGEIVILKVVDSKSVALLPGDYVYLKCRYQPEVLDAMYNNEHRTNDALVYEYDYCRLGTPVIQITEGR